MYTNLYEIMEVGIYNWSMIIIENFPCNNSLEAKKKERYYIEQLKATLNSNIPTRTHQEYYIDNKEKILEYNQDYYNDNKEKILEYKQEYYNDNKEKILEYKQEYYIHNKEKILDRNKDYHTQNKEKILERKKRILQ